MQKLFLTLSVLLLAVSDLSAIYVKQQGQSATFGAGAVAGDLALYGPAGWAADGAIVGGTNAYLGGAKGWDIVKGSVIGTMAGYRYAKSEGRNPWAGKEEYSTI
jgi:hypothetical protein